MLLLVIGILTALWLAYAGWKFYYTMDWEDQPESSPDLRGMHKKEAELMHIQEVLAEAVEHGKLSGQARDEFNRFCEAEIADMRKIENAWKNRRKK